MKAFAWCIGGRNWWGIRQLLFCNYFYRLTGKTLLSLPANKLRLFLFLLPQLINSVSVFSSSSSLSSCFSVVGDAGGENSSDSSSLSSSLLFLVPSSSSSLSLRGRGRNSHLEVIKRKEEKEGRRQVGRGHEHVPLVGAGFDDIISNQVFPKFSRFAFVEFLPRPCFVI